MAVLTTAEAASRLGVTERQARNLAAHGEITLLARGVVDGESVTQYLRRRGAVTRRVWSEGTAWAALHVLAGLSVDWVSAAQLSRLRSQLSHMTATEVASRVRNRAVARRYDCHRSARERVAAEVVAGAATIGDLSSQRDLDGYVATQDLASIVSRFRLREDSTGTITIRSTNHLDKARRLSEADPDLLAAIDLATSADARERGAAFSLIADALGSL